MNLRVIASYCDLLRPQISTDIIIYWIITDFIPHSTEFFVHRLAQIYTDFLISKDIVIITDYNHH